MLAGMEEVIGLSNYMVYYKVNGPVGSNHGNLQNTPLVALGYRALRGLPRCTVRGEVDRGSPRSAL